MIQLTVNDMTCNHCVSTITRAVKDVDGASRCEVDLTARRVRITSTHPATEFVEAIREAGYTPVAAA